MIFRFIFSCSANLALASAATRRKIYQRMSSTAKGDLPGERRKNAIGASEDRVDSNREENGICSKRTVDWEKLSVHEKEIYQAHKAACKVSCSPLLLARQRNIDPRQSQSFREQCDIFLCFMPSRDYVFPFSGFLVLLFMSPVRFAGSYTTRNSRRIVKDRIGVACMCSTVPSMALFLSFPLFIFAITGSWIWLGRLWQGEPITLL